MRVLAVLFAALALSSCAWVRHEIAPAPLTVKPDSARLHKPHAERPAPQVQAATPAQPVEPPAPPPPDYAARCRAMADNRANDAKQLGASAVDQTKVQSDTYRDCMAQSVR
ncbi:MAG TPA: hypothetical protein VII56_05735 [Rhizomicrobium sp.]